MAISPKVAAMKHTLDVSAAQKFEAYIDGYLSSKYADERYFTISMVDFIAIPPAWFFNKDIQEYITKKYLQAGWTKVEFDEQLMRIRFYNEMTPSERRQQER